MHSTIDGLQQPSYICIECSIWSEWHAHGCKLPTKLFKKSVSHICDLLFFIQECRPLHQSDNLQSQIHLSHLLP